MAAAAVVANGWWLSTWAALMMVDVAVNEDGGVRVVAAAAGKPGVPTCTHLYPPCSVTVDRSTTRANTASPTPLYIRGDSFLTLLHVAPRLGPQRFQPDCPLLSSLSSKKAYLDIVYSLVYLSETRTLRTLPCYSHPPTRNLYTTYQHRVQIH